MAHLLLRVAQIDRGGGRGGWELQQRYHEQRPQPEISGPATVGIDMDTDSDLAVSINWGSFARWCSAPLKGLGVDPRQV